MTKITIDENREITPRQQFVKGFNIAFAKGDMKYVLDCFSDNITWNVINHEPVYGKEAVREMLKQMDEVADELVIDDIVCDGNKCVVNGKLVYKTSAVAFSDTYQFTDDSKNMKIKSLKGYPIELTRS